MTYSDFLYRVVRDQRAMRHAVLRLKRELTARIWPFKVVMSYVGWQIYIRHGCHAYACLEYINNVVVVKWRVREINKGHDAEREHSVPNLPDGRANAVQIAIVLRAVLEYKDDTKLLPLRRGHNPRIPEYPKHLRTHGFGCGMFVERKKEWNAIKTLDQVTSLLTNAGFTGDDIDAMYRLVREDGDFERYYIHFTRANLPRSLWFQICNIIKKS